MISYFNSKCVLLCFSSSPKFTALLFSVSVFSLPVPPFTANTGFPSKLLSQSLLHECIRSLSLSYFRPDLMPQSHTDVVSVITCLTPTLLFSYSFLPYLLYLSLGSQDENFFSSPDILCLFYRSWRVAPWLPKRIT